MGYRGLPKFEKIEIAHIEPAIDACIEEISAIQNKLESSADISENILDLLAEISELMHHSFRLWGICTL